MGRLGRVGDLLAALGVTANGAFGRSRGCGSGLNEALRVRVAKLARRCSCAVPAVPRLGVQRLVGVFPALGEPSTLRWRELRGAQVFDLEIATASNPRLDS